MSMKKIIDGKTYNTDTATELGNYRNNPGNFSFVDESLYRTKKGAYFLAGKGGPMSKYAQSCGLNEWCGGSDIHPISEQEARRWLERHCDVENYIAAFGEPEEA